TRYGIASSSDGSHLYALSDDGTQATLSVSHDGGISWADTPLVAATSGAIASSADGARSVLMLNGVAEWSEDYGTTRTTVATQSVLAVAVAMSAGGLRVLIADGNGPGSIYLSTDGGGNWGNAIATFATGWAALGMSAEGGHVFALPNGNDQMRQS